ncbi:hypothetical protein SAMN05444521_6109 [Streptomyces sp. 3214.6]|nr:hypothetical protein SAMN05444521_6109 [Streptomyces sp. 3214.6]
MTVQGASSYVLSAGGVESQGEGVVAVARLVGLRRPVLPAHQSVGVIRWGLQRVAVRARWPRRTLLPGITLLALGSSRTRRPGWPDGTRRSRHRRVGAVLPRRPSRARAWRDRGSVLARRSPRSRDRYRYLRARGQIVHGLRRIRRHRRRARRLHLRPQRPHVTGQRADRVAALVGLRRGRRVTLVRRLDAMPCGPRDPEQSVDVERVSVGSPRGRKRPMGAPRHPAHFPRVVCL